MKEVSCRALDVLFREIGRRKLAVERLLEGTTTPRDVLQHKDGRISWSELATIMGNAGRIFSHDELVEIGRLHFDSPMNRFISVIARLLFSPMDFYRWMNGPRGPGHERFTCVAAVHREVGPNQIDLELTLPEGYAPCPEFFTVSIGAYSEMSRLLGLPRAHVELTPLPRGGRFRIVVPKGGAIATIIRRVMMWPLTLRAAGHELKELHETLQRRYEQLDEAQRKVALQAKQLQTAHTFGELIHGDLDLDRTLDAVARALVERAGFASVSVEVDAEVDGARVTRYAAHGDDATASSQRVHALRGRGGRPLGQLRVTALAVDRGDREELLDFVAPAVSLALDNAIAHQIVKDYRRGLEIRVGERTAELEQARDTLAETVRHLDEAKQVRDRIFANINHEIRTPLSLILLAVDAARIDQSGDGAQTNRSLSAIEQAARRLLRMVSDLLLLAEGRERELGLDLVACDLGDLVERTASAWVPAARAARRELIIDVTAACCVKAHPTAIDRVVSNLLSNALKYTPPGGRIEVRVTAPPGRAVLEVADTGPGIDSELRGRLFGRFERGQPPIHGAVSGSGLGLSLVKELVEAQGGTIEVDSEPGRGATFRVTWPREDGAPVVVGGEALTPSEFGMAIVADERDVYEPDGTARATLLLAEDDALLRDRIARLLSNEYRVVVAADGLGALELAKKHRPDLLITDLAMPGMDGIELTRHFRALEGNRVAPTLLLTAFGEIGHRLAGFEAGAVDYIVKPFEPAELRARVRSQLALRGAALQLVDAEKLATLATASAGLAHEMRNPANAIVNAIEPLRERLPPELLTPGTPVAELIDVIEHSAEQIAVVSRDLLGFRRNAELERRPVALAELVRRVCLTIRPALRDVELRERIEYGGPLTCAEPLIAQVLTNLVDNAAYAAGRGGWVEVRTAIEDGRAIIEVRDSGPGVPPNLRERVFEPFFTTKPPGSGTGLGLPAASKIVTRHGGSLDVRSDPHGTVFRVELPLEASA